jgi:hypothetical protein
MRNERGIRHQKLTKLNMGCGHNSFPSIGAHVALHLFTRMTAERAGPHADAHEGLQPRGREVSMVDDTCLSLPNKQSVLGEVAVGGAWWREAIGYF